MISTGRGKTWKQMRIGQRVHSVKDISLTYEGHSEEVVVRPPDLSRRGMFISTSRTFPEGAVLNLRFRLAVTGVEVQTRCEVRHCLRGVGVGVEFIGLSAKVVRQIDREMKLCCERPARRHTTERATRKIAKKLRAARKRSQR
jgi:hypothetical protein